MESEQIYCCVCGSAGATRELLPDGDTFEASCNCCGRFRITGTLFPILGRQKSFNELRPYLSAYLRQTHEVGGMATISTENWEASARTHAHTPVATKLDMMRRLCAARTPAPGYKVGFGSDDFVLLDARDVAEFQYLFDAIVEEGFLKKLAPLVGIITPAGWSSLNPPAGGVPGTCFVAMWFDSSVDAAFTQGIAPAVEEDCGFRVIQLSKVEHNENINDKIIGEIRSAQFLIADFTGHRGGVYFEAGFALGLGRPVIWTCRKDAFDVVHFDTRPYNYILWETPGEVRLKLANRMRATIPNARPASS